MLITKTGGVECKCRDCGRVFIMGGREFLRSSMTERAYCKKCRKKEGKKNGRV